MSNRQMPRLIAAAKHGAKTRPGPGTPAPAGRADAAGARMTAAAASEAMIEANQPPEPKK